MKCKTHLIPFWKVFKPLANANLTRFATRQTMDKTGGGECDKVYYKAVESVKKGYSAFFCRALMASNIISATF